MALLSAGDIALMNDSLDELSNATLVKIETPGAPDAYGEPGAPTATWTGRADGFLERQDHQEVSGGEQVRIDVTTFLLFDAAGAPVTEVAGPNWSGSTVVIEDGRQAVVVTRRFSVIGMEHQQDNTLDSILLTLDNEAVA